MTLDETKTPMTSTPGSKDTETQDASAPRGDERLTQAHEQIKRYVRLALDVLNGVPSIVIGIAVTVRIKE